MGGLTGKSKSVSKNKAYPWLKDQFGDDASSLIGTGSGALNSMSALLGQGGDPAAANTAYQGFLNSTGYHNVLDQAMRGVTGTAASRGLLQSGATAKALQDRAGDLGQQYFANYLGQLGGVAQQGLGAGTNLGQLIAGAGNYSKNTQSQGLLSALAPIGAAIATGGASSLFGGGLKALGGATGHSLGGGVS